eukprot:CAMPEP_0201667478 /NCGR_PEP_ID=MMETSP0494-20130426/15175_1 /ASSEMBLY_ACC=CAM_ASM_000839 /TAXON_ID=420259 /ORGANISM="Thalassiosira gravida, Strain GMp14c1" /LENGTH=619 /DNA_ID=CAMNT_0048147471 /DNA_START=62 /DNA_END=1921 /DNA_ORIENTATION=-
MPGTMKNSAASGRLFRRHTEKEVAGNGDGKGKRSRSSGRKRIIRGGSRLASSMRLGRSRSRFSTISSTSNGGSHDLPPDILAVSDTASISVSSVETSSVLSVSSTVMEVHETVMVPSNIEDVTHNRSGHEDEEEHSNCEDFFSKLLDLIQCFPRKIEEPPEIEKKRDTLDVSNYIMGIECILEQTSGEESGNIEKVDSIQDPLNDTPYLSRPPPSEWVQDPLLLVATPGRSMKIHRIRRVIDPSYFESPDPLHSETIQKSFMRDDCCNNQSIQLPINNGKEPPLHAHVIDFESNLFAGTALFRIRDTKDWNSIQSMAPTTNDANSMTSQDYFSKYNRKFQMVIRGKFKPDVVMVDCMAGLLLDQHLVTSKKRKVNFPDGLPCEPVTNANIDTKNKSKRSRRLKIGKSPNDDSLPPKWALRAAVKAAAVFSPRMDADLESSNPRIISPLCATAQTISVLREASGEGASRRLDETLVEPSPHDDASLVHDLNMLPTKKLDGSSTDCVQQRKRASDAACDARVQSLAKNPCQGSQMSPCFDPKAEYTFEFLQHLIDYNDLSLDLGKVLGKVRVGGALRGQPIRYVAGVKQRNRKATAELCSMNMYDMDCIWSFDLWHKSLVI